MEPGNKALGTCFGVAAGGGMSCQRTHKDIKYEYLITDAKNEIKNLLSFCDLDWEDSCLEFYKNKRPVKTVSSAQVRKSFYNSSVDSYKNYENFLGDLYSSLDKI